MSRSGSVDDPFIEHSRLLFFTAYQMLGSVADTEDVLQDAWLAWNRTNRDHVRHPRAYLVRTVTNLARTHLTSARATRESCVGPWLPESLLLAPDIVAEVELEDDVHTAILVLLETLAPVARAIFVLREVFGYSHSEIARLLGRPEVTVRQIAHRSHARVRAGRPRFGTDRAERRQVSSRFLEACATGDVGALIKLLART